MEIVKIIGVAFISAICSLLVKNVKPELSFAVNVAGGLLILLQIFSVIPRLSEFFNEIAAITGIESDIIKLLLKLVAIGYLTELCASVLSDFGASSLSDKVVLAGKLLIIVTALPIFENLLKIVRGFLNS